MAKDNIYCLDGEDSELPPQRDDGNITDDVADDTHDVLDALQSELGGRGRGVLYRRHLSRMSEQGSGRRL